MWLMFLLSRHFVHKTKEAPQRKEGEYRRRTSFASLDSFSLTTPDMFTMLT